MNPHDKDRQAGSGDDWLAALLHDQAATPGPADDGFSDTVLRKLPPPRQRPAGIGLLFFDACAMAAAAALLALLLPDALGPFVNAGSAGSAGNAGSAPGLLARGALEHALPALALLAWLGWWSVRQASDDEA